MYVLLVVMEKEKENGNSRKNNLSSLVDEALMKEGFKHVLEMMKPWQTLLNKAPNKGGKEEQRDRI